jgi:hypothetical protein
MNSAPTKMKLGATAAAALSLALVAGMGAGTAQAAATDHLSVTKLAPMLKTATVPHPITQTVTGERNVGETLTASLSGWTLGTVTEQWYRDGKAIAGATSPTYMQVTADYGHEITVKVTGSAPGYTTVSKTSVTTVKTAYPFMTGLQVTVAGNLATGSIAAAQTDAGTDFPMYGVSYTY